MIAEDRKKETEKPVKYTPIMKIRSGRLSLRSSTSSWTLYRNRSVAIMTNEMAAVKNWNVSSDW